MSAQAPEISIIVPVYNVREYLEECLISLQDQTLADIEILCIDDGSDDGSLDILEKYAKTDKRIKVIKKKNGGVASARNAGLKTAVGKYIMFVDSDDIVSEHICETSMKCAEENDAEIVVYGGKSFPTFDWADWTLATRDIVYTNQGIDALLFERGASPLMCNKLYLRSFLDEQKSFFNENLILGEDNAFQFSVFPAAKNIAFIKDKLYFYRIRNDSAVGSSLSDYDKRLKLHLDVVEYVFQTWRERGFADNRRTDLVAWSISFLYEEAKKAFFDTRVYVSKLYGALLDSLLDGNPIDSLRLDPWISHKLNYLLEAGDAANSAPILTVIVNNYWNTEASNVAMSNLLCQSIQNLQIIVNDSLKGRVNKDIERCWHNDPRVCFLSENELVSNADIILGDYIMLYDGFANYEMDAIRCLLETAGVIDPIDTTSGSTQSSEVADLVVCIDSSGFIPLPDPYKHLEQYIDSVSDNKDSNSAAEYADDLFSSVSIYPGNKILSTNLYKRTLSRCASRDSRLITAFNLSILNSERIRIAPKILFTFVSIDKHSSYNLEIIEEIKKTVKDLEAMPDASMRSSDINWAMFEFLLIIFFLQESFKRKRVLFESMRSLINEAKIAPEDPHATNWAQANLIDYLQNDDFDSFVSETNRELLKGMLTRDALNLTGKALDSNELKRLNKVVKDLKKSISFRTGRAITSIPRKAISLARKLKNVWQHS